jgi:flagellar basal body-associated protein FliL
MKLLKFILKLILIIVLVVIVGAVIFLIVVSDNSTSDYTPSTEVKSVEQVLGKNIYDSSESISLIDKNDRSTSDNNKITIDISYQELNDCLTDIIRTNGSINNSTYLLPDGT